MSLDLKRIEQSYIAGESSQNRKSKEPSAVEIVAKAAFIQQEESPTQATLLDRQLIEVRKKKDLEWKKNQLIQALNVILEKESNDKFCDVINNIVDIINKLVDCDPDKIKYAIADYFRSLQFFSCSEVEEMLAFLTKHLEGELKEQVVGALNLVFCTALAICRDTPFSINDFKYLISVEKDNNVLGFMSTTGYIKKGKEFRDLAVDLFEKIKERGDYKPPTTRFANTLFQIAETYAEEANLELTIKYIRQTGIGEYFYTQNRRRYHAIANKLFENEKLSLEERVLARSTLLSVMFATPSSLLAIGNLRQIGRETGRSSFSESLPAELHDIILSFADSKSLGNLAQTNVTEARRVYRIERERAIKFLKLILANVKNSFPIYLELNDIKCKLENMPNCNLDNVKYIIAKYFSLHKLDYSIPIELKNLASKYDFGRFTSIWVSF